MSVFCLVHAAFQGAWSWDLLIPQLEAKGHFSVAMDLPIENPEATLLDYAEVAVQALPSNEDDVILVGASMAGTVIPLVAAQRRVRKLVYLGALIPYPGMSVIEQMYEDVVPDMWKAAGFETPYSSKFEQIRDEPDIFNSGSLEKSLLENEAVAMEFLFHDCEPEVARLGVSKLRNHLSSAHLTEIFPLQALPDVESSYIVCTEDRVISPAWSKYAARKRLGVEAIEFPSGHCPYLSQSARLAELLTQIAS
ncbi:hypothetical protein DSM106972_073170 [Dulcicalothrix desertica PCC 7102]|uniref:AB hydrolase-1 domain-containing protein n=1 Tax=Dulcicalothrix desertica PCC 7102 TaxID=232991 RepID=A0A433V383_9CYAN|nr:alpha/beta hydrolase [Dulcicalothrix desertica]RUT00546.1 hypothetical protein DSM106972_073170 [Dulcicalothrix desertica PCC 7102]TWH53310.1 pimeloyl-ACP methyl ester carboxylesterase [Dulcicalothrix desertica PCC 7102]